MTVVGGTVWSVAKKQRRARQPDRDARRRAKLKARGDRSQSSENGHLGPLWGGGGWSSGGDGFDLSLPDLDWEAEQANCPVADHCAGCGKTEDLRVMISAFSGGEVACATVCSGCDGTSIMRLSEIGPGGVDERVAAHSAHRSP